jgi:Na+/melibiose symporter-like transporter
LSLPRLLAYALPGLPLAALGLPLYVYLPTYYAQQLGLGFGVVGGILLAARIWDVLTDPLVGWLSDRSRSRFGRRLPWFAAGLPLVTLGAWRLFAPPQDAEGVYLLVWSMLTYLGWTLLLLPYTALGAELSDDYHERTRLSAGREVAFIAGTLLAVAFPAVWMQMGGTRADALAGLGDLLVWLFPLAGLILLVGIREPAAPPRVTRRLRESVNLLAANRPARKLLLIYLLNSIANGLPASLFVLYVDQVLGASPLWSGVLLCAYFLAGVAGMPGWLWLSRRLGKHRAWAIAMNWAALVFVWVPLLERGQMEWFLVICLLSGLSLGADTALPSAMQADVVDEDTAAGGDTRTGLYFALWSMATKLALALAVGLAFPVLELAGVTASGVSGSGGVLVLSLLYGGLPALIKLAAVPWVWRFPLDQARQETLRHRIAERRAASAKPVMEVEHDSNDTDAGGSPAADSARRGVQHG